jgi:hypothetical protein
MISFIHRLVFGPKQSPQPIDLPGYGIVKCTRCHSHLRTGFALSLMGHLSTEHKMGENEAIYTAVHMLELLQTQIQKQKRK